MKYDIKALEAKMKKSTESLEYNLASIRASQANARVLDRVSFEYYGSMTPVAQMADVRVADARTLTIKPYDKQTLKAIEKAILTSDIGITPSNDGETIRLIFPQLTEERRKDLAKQIQKMAEECKVAIRNIRRDANDECKNLKKDGSMTEDEQKSSEKEIQDVTDKYTKLADTISAAKQKEVMSI